MVKRWMLYLAAVSGCVVFYLAYQKWFAWFLLMGVLCFPVASLLMSLPAMMNLQVKISAPAWLPVGAAQRALFLTGSTLPLPPNDCCLLVTRPLTGESWLLRHGDPLPTEHCGQLLFRPENARVYDYLGLFYLRIRRRSGSNMVVRPASVAVPEPPRLEQYAANAWKPKPGGGFSEHHELRQYRPGDNLNQIHWKLSAKTGKYIIREAMEPEKNRVLLELTLRGSPAQLDEKFGKLVYMSKHLLELGLPHEIRALTGGGVEQLKVTDEASLWEAVDRLLGCTSAPDDAVLPAVAAGWQLSIGGDGGEA